jgi:hypothetical protein
VTSLPGPAVLNHVDPGPVGMTIQTNPKQVVMACKKGVKLRL